MLYFPVSHFPNQTYQRLRVPTIRNRTFRHFRTLIMLPGRPTGSINNQTSSGSNISNMSYTLGHRTISSVGTQHDLVQEAKTTCHPRRDSFMFISFHLSFYIIYYKISIKASVKLLGQLVSFTLLSLYNTLYSSKKHYKFISLSRSLSTRTEPIYKTTNRHYRPPSLSKNDR